MTAVASKGELRPLTSFCFLAAFYVFIFHIQIRTPLFSDGPLKNLASKGAIGMTMFFMLSGFILMHVYQNSFEMKKYLLNRLARVYPVYLLAAILALPWIVLDAGSGGQGEAFFKGALRILIILVFGLLLLQAWLPQLFVHWNNSASWSISNEAFFYGVFPLFRSWLPGLGTGRLVLLLLVSISISVMIPLSKHVFENTPTPGFSLFYSLPAYRIPEFFAGAIIYLLANRVQPRKVLHIILILTVLAFVTYLSLFAAYVPTFTLHNFLGIPAIGAALVLLYNIPASSTGFWNWGFSVWLGKISYCFYSFQFHVLEGLRYFVDWDKFGGFYFGILSFGILILVSAIAHHLVEEPCRKWIRSRSAKTGADLSMNRGSV